MNSVLIESQFLPPLSYFSLLTQFNEIIIERCEHYVKQTYRNRFYINTSSGKEMVVIPLTSKHGKVLITEVKIDYTQKWLNGMWRTIQSAYGNAAYFDFYAEDFHAILFRRVNFLYDLNQELLSLCLKCLRWNTVVKESNHYDEEILPPIYDCRNVIRDKNKVHDLNLYQPVTYPQVFGSKFVPDLSLLDLIYCMGPDSNSVIQRSAGIK